MKTLSIALMSLLLLSGCTTSTPVYESTLADGTVIRSTFLED